MEIDLTHGALWFWSCVSTAYIESANANAFFLKVLSITIEFFNSLSISPSANKKGVFAGLRPRAEERLQRQLEPVAKKLILSEQFSFFFADRNIAVAIRSSPGVRSGLGSGPLTCFALHTLSCAPRTCECC